MNDKTQAGAALLSAAQRVYQDLRQRIVEMRWLPGTRIVERDIAVEHGASRTPVHEAVLRLADEGLVEIQPRIGTYVARIPRDQLDEAMFIRTALEVALIREVVERITPAQLATLRELVERQHVCVQRNDYAGFHCSDERFHQTFAEIAGHPGAWAVIEQGKVQVDRFRQLTLPVSGRMDRVIGEHEAIVHALEQGSADAAADALRQHLGRVAPHDRVGDDPSWADYFC